MRLHEAALRAGRTTVSSTPLSQHVAALPAPAVGALIQEAWTTALEGLRATLHVDPSAARSMLLRATTQELGPTREAVIDTVAQRADLSVKQATETYAVAEEYEANPRSIWSYVQGLTHVSQRRPWQDGRFALDRAAGRLLTLVLPKHSRSVQHRGHTVFANWSVRNMYTSFGPP